MDASLSHVTLSPPSSYKREALRRQTRRLRRKMLFESLEDRSLLAALYWDPNGTAAGVGGAGTWDLAAEFWTEDPAGLTGHVAWNNAANDTAVFAGTAGTVTINPATSPITAGGLDFDVTGYTVATAASKSLAFATGANIDVDTGVTATISGVISGANGFTKIGAGDLVLSGTNTYTGVTTINAGTVVASSNAALGTTAGNTVIGNGATLDVRATISEPINVRGTGVGGNGALISSTSGTVSGAVTQAAASSIGGNGNLTISGVVSGNFTLTKVGTGTLTLSGTNTYTSATVISAGTLVANNSAALGTTGGGVTIASGATLDVRNNIGTEAISVSGTGVGGNGALITGSGTATGTVGGTVTLTGATTIGGTGTLNINGNVVGAFPLTKIGTGTTTLSGSATNTYSSLTVSAGTLRVGRESALPAGVRTDTNLVVDSGATLAFDVGGTGEFTAASIETLSALGTATGGFQNGSFLGLDASGAPSGTFTYSNPITNTNGGANVIGVTSFGTGIVRLSGANTYTGPTQVRSGTLVFVNPTSLYGGVPANWTPTNLVVSSGATLGFGVGPGEFTAADLDTLNDLGTATGGFLNGSRFGIDTTNATAPFEYAGAITNTNAGASAIGFTKIGPGTLVLSGANTYTGPTTILGGTLEKGSDTGIPTGTALVIGDRSGNVGSLDLTNFSQSVSSITAASNTATANTITVGAGQTLTVTGTGGITVGVDLGGSSSTTTRLNVTGPGSLVVNNTAANVTVGLAQASQNSNNTGTLDLTGLGSVTLGSVAAPINEVRVAYGQTNDGTLLLSNTSNLITANNIYVGNSLAANATGSPALVLGTGTNVLNANLIGIGMGKSTDSTISFASQAPGSPGTVTIAGKAGGTSTANITIGSNTTTDTAAIATGTLDLRGHEATVNAGTVKLGETTRGASTSGGNGTLSFDQGTFTATTVTMATKGGAASAPAVGVLNVGGGSFTVTTLNAGVYNSATGAATTAATATVNVTGGTLTVGTLQGATKTAAGSGSATSNINVSGGELIVNTLFRLASQATAGTATGNLNVTGTGVVTSNVDITDGGGATTTSITLDGGTLDMTGHAIGPGTPIDTLVFASGTLQNVSEINDGAGLTKTTDGTLILAGTNTYTGPTTVNVGTLVVNGTLAAGSPVTVNDGATLGGTGTISGTVTTNGTGEIDAGGAAAGGGTLQIEGPVTLAPTSTFGVQIGGTTAGDGAGTYDQITVTGPLDLSGATLDVALNGFTPAAGNQFTIINKTSAGPVTGTFSLAGDPLIQNEQFAVGGTTFQINYSGGDGNDVVLTALNGAANSAPTDIALSPTTIAENAGPNATVGTFTTTDPDTGNTFTYTLVPGTGSTDNAAFNISGNTLRATNSLDFETQQTYNIRVRTTDAGGLFFEEAFTIDVTDVNEAVAGFTVTPTTGLTTTEAGGTATFTIVLNTQPTADVTIPISSSDTTEGTVSPASVTFTTTNWNVPQTVTVSGVNDAIVDGTIAYNIVTGAATSTDANYTGLNPADVAVSNTDNDAAGVTVAPTSGLTTTEAGGTATFTIVLNTQPTADVTIPLSSSDTTEGTVSPASVTFTTANWNVPQTVTVTGVNDSLVDGTIAYNVVTGAATSTDVAYSGFNAADVGVSNTDNDTVGVTVAPTSGLTTTEAGGTATFTIVLNAQPTADVTIPLSSSDTTEGTVSPASVTFTTTNWNVPQTVTVTGVNDAIVDGTVAYNIVTGAATSTDTGFSGFNAADVSVSNTDNDAAGVTVAPTTGLTTTEAGGTATFTIVLNTQPTADVTIPLNSSDTTEGTVSPASVTFTTTNWNVPQTVTVTGVDDAIVDGTIAYNVVTGAATSTDVAYSGFNAADVAVSNTDNDVATPAGITVTPTTGLTTTEAGGTATFTIVLNTQPTADVTIPLSSSDTTEGTVSPASVTFTTTNWNTPQTVTVTGVNDAIVDGTVAYTVVTGPATSTDVGYSGLNAADVAASNTDNDTAGVTVAPTSGLTTTEAGGTATFTVVLSAQPTANVTIPLSSSDTTEGTVSPSSLTFTTANWNIPQTVTVTGVDDAIVDGTIAYTIVTGAATSTDPAFSGFNAADVGVSNTDNDVATPAGVTVTPTSGLTTTEAGGTATFTVVLNTQPTANVVIPLSSSDTTEGTVSPTSLTFTTANWNIPQTVTVTGVDDAIVDGTIGYTIVTGAATSTDVAYSGLNAADVAISNTDNDSTGTGTITVTPSSGLTTTEAGGVAAFFIVLNSQPTANVTISLTSSDPTEGTVSPASVTFTPTNWNFPQIVIVTGVDDAIDDGDVNYTIVTGAATSTDTNFSGVNPVDVSLTNTDNDDAAATPGLTITPNEGLTTTEAGGSATFTLALRTQPTANVTIPISSSDPTEGTVSMSSVTFTPANWSVPQTVTVTGVDDIVDDGDVAYSIITGIASSSDPAYQGVNSTDVSVTNLDDDTAANTPPTISDIGNQSTSENAPLSNIPFTVGDAETPPGNLTLTATSSNTTLFPNGSITFGGSGGNRTITLNPAANQSGTATITVTVNDGTGGTSSDTFTVTVNGVNDPPVANDTSLNTTVNAPVSGVLSATDPDSPSLTYAIVMNPALGTLTSFDAATGSFTYTPNSGATGLDVFTFSVTDGTSTDEGTVRISIQEAGPSVIVNGGELIVNGTSNTDNIVITPVSPGIVKVRTDAATGNYPVSTQLTINAGDGNDYVSVEGVTVPTTINLGGGDDYASSGAQDDTIIGGLGRDQINAGAGNNTLWGDNLNEQDLATGGDDVLSSMGGNDVLYGGGGADQLYPGAGNDYVNAGQGDDLVSGGAGEDRIYGGGGNDSLYGDEGNDVISGGAGSDTIVGRTGSDVLIGGIGADSLNGDEGNDLLVGNDTTNSASSTAGDTNDMALMALLANWAATRPAGLASSISAGSDGASDSLQGYTGDDDFYLASGDSAGDFGLPFMGTDRMFNI